MINKVKALEARAAQLEIVLRDILAECESENTAMESIGTIVVLAEGALREDGANV